MVWVSTETVWEFAGAGTKFTGLRTGGSSKGSGWEASGFMIEVARRGMINQWLVGSAEEQEVDLPNFQDP